MTHPEPQPDSFTPAKKSAQEESTETPRVIPAEELFAGSREVHIQHGSQRYRLRITAAGKLILTK